jgi:hypothetical protein
MNYDSIRMSIKLDENETYAVANNSMRRAEIFCM